MPEIPKSVAASNEFREELLNRDEAAAFEMARRWVRVEDSVRGRLEKLVTQIQEAQAGGQEVSRVWLLQQERYTALLGQLTAEINRFNNYSVGIIDGLQNDAVDFARVTAADLIMATASDVGRVGLTFNRLSTEAAENITALARGGNPLNLLLEANYPTATREITDRLISGVATGINPREVTRDIMKNGLSQAYNHTILVARDQHMRAYRTATAQAYQNSGVVNRYRRLAAKNDRTCLACLALDGEIFDVGETMPLHPQDRCTMLPIIGNLPPVNFQTGEEWFKRQPEAYQRKALGPGKYELWKGGGFQFKQLVTVKNNPTWGPNANITTLADLRRGLGGLTARLPIPPAPPPPTAPPTPTGRTVPQFKSRAAAEKWAREKYPNITVDFSKMDVQGIQGTLEAFSEMSEKYPYVTDSMQYMGSYGKADLRPSLRRRRRWGGEIAHAYRTEGILAFNPKYYSDSDKLIQSSANMAASNWTFQGRPDQVFAATVYHEYGHLLDGYYMNNAPPSGSAIAGRQVLAWFGQVARNDETNGLTRYGRTNIAEAIAESFSAMNLYPPEQWPKASQQLNAVLGIMEDEYNRDYEVPAFETEADYLAWGEAEDKRRADLLRRLDEIVLEGKVN